MASRTETENGTKVEAENKRFILYICLPDCMSVRLTVCLYDCLPDCLSICLYVCLPDCLSVCLFA